MNTKNALTLACLATATLATPVVANAHNYNTVEGGFISRDLGREDDSGLRIAGSAEIARQFALFGEFSDVGDLDQLTFGGMYHQALQHDLDWYGGVSLEMVDAGAADDTGIGLRAGLRWTTPDPRFEINPEIRHFEVFDDGVTSLRVAGYYAITRPFDLQLALQTGDDDRFEAGARYNF
ncbi:porin family outer membrane protein [Oceanococcus atlanticus]|uniref:Porin family outer membrane protein n=1 Tax=Oceanococcus atlanticus TaxID=1317117 RepID=A0A1Y1SBV3_9GAMM|nr:hypothetical protein [Oceanococcus atlanticus]ORE86098.1 porin family outer membrane protein [Oceanococcus atlanticus]